MKKLRADYIYRQEFEHLLAALTTENRLALEVSLTTGLRISDVLNFRTCKLAERMTVRELKTGKSRRIRLSYELLLRLTAIAGKVFVFENRLSPLKHRTRQAVYKDLRRAAALFRIPAGIHVSPHTARKVYAVGQYKRTCSLAKVQELLNHSDEAVTMLYAFADVMVKRRVPGITA